MDAEGVWIGLLAVVLATSCGGESERTSPPPGADACRDTAERVPGPPYDAGTLTAVEVSHHRESGDRYDRVALTFACAVPEFHIEEPRRIEACCKPTVIEIPGRHLVKLVFRGAQAHDRDADRWTATVDSRLRRPVDAGLPILRSYVLAEDWHGLVSLGFGLSRRASCWTAVRQTSDSEAVLTLHFRSASKRGIDPQERRTACV